MTSPLARLLLAVALVPAAHASPLAAARTPIFAGLASGGTVSSLLPLPDGRVVVSRNGGNFTNGVLSAPNPSRTTLCYVLTDGSFAPLGADLVTGIERPTATGAFNVMLRLPDGKILVGGNFNAINGHPSDRVARLNPDGSSDTTFTTGAGASGEVRTLALDSAGRILVGGTFNQFSQIIGKNYLVRLSADGTLDSTFVSRANGVVSKIVTLPDGGFIATGEHQIPDFTYRHVARYDASGTFAVAYGPASRVGSVALKPAGDRLYIASSVTPFLSRVNPADGTLDTTFALGASAPNGAVENVVVQPDGRVLVYGNFTAPYNRLARYLPDGTLDPDFNPGTGLNLANTSFPIAYDPAGRIWLGGAFTGYKSSSAQSILVLDGDIPALAWARQPNAVSLSARPIATLRGSLTTAPATATFTAEARSTDPVTYQWLKNGSPLAASARITGVNSTTLNLIGVTAADEGSYTLAATTAASGTITSEPAEFTLLGAPEILLSPVGGLREAGLNSTLSVAARGAGSLTYQWFRGTSTSPTAAISGATSATYTLPSPAISDTAYYSVQVTNSIGSFTTEPVLVTYQSLAGSLISGATPTFAGKVLGILPLPDSNGTVVFGEFNGAYHADGNFSVVNLRGVAHITAAGTLDTTWYNGADNTVAAAVLDNSSRILVGGSFSNMVGYGGKYSLARLNFQGQLDTTFTSPFSSAAFVKALAVDSTGRIYVGGTFGNVIGQTGTFRLIRLNADLSLDTAYNTAAAVTLNTANNVVNALRILPGDQLLVASDGGLRRLNTDGTLDATFTNPSNQSALCISALPGTTDFIAGSNTSFNSVRRLTSTGTLVTPYPAMGTGTGASNITHALQPQADGRYFIGGLITTYNSLTVGRFLRLNSDGTADSSFNTGTGFSDVVNAFALDAQGRLWVGGSFLNYRGSRVSRHAAAGAGSIAVLATAPITPPDPGSPTPDAYTAHLIAAGVPANQRGTAEDPDGDGSSNADEFANSTNPALAGDAKSTLSYAYSNYVLTPAGIDIPYTAYVSGQYNYTQPSGTSMRVGTNSFTGPGGTTFRGWAPTDFDSTLGYLPAVTTTPIAITLNANRRLFPVLGLPLTQPLPGYLWRSGGNNLWVGTTDVFPPSGGTGQGTARSTGLETVGDEAWLETTVTAPGSLKFNWRLDVASGAGATLEAFAGGTRLDLVDTSGGSNFATVRTFPIPGNGATPIRFKLTRFLTSTLFAAKGQESAYLANFIYTPTDVLGDYLAAAGVALAQRGPGADPDGDGVPNLVEFAFGNNPNNPSNIPQIYPSSGRSRGDAIQAAAPGTVLDPTQTYYTIQIRTPKNSNGVILTPQASGNLTDFGTGITQLNAYGPPIDDGLFTIQSYFMTPGTAAAPTGTGFCRLRATR